MCAPSPADTMVVCTLVMLVSAFAGREPVLAAYRQAVEERYRFFSFGDAMLIIDTIDPQK